MTAIDGLSWEAGLAFDVHGARVGIRLSDASAMGLARGCLPFGWRPARSPRVDALFSMIMGGPADRGVRRFHILYSAWDRVVRTLDREEMLHELASRLDFAVAERSSERVFVHAGVVTWAGKAILLPGRSLSGKTTLVAALVRAGATYFSDEFAVFDGDGLVHPHPRPLRLRVPGSVEPGSPVTIEQLGATAGRDPVRVGLVANTRYVAGASWQPKRLAPSVGLLKVLDNTVVAQTNPGLALPTLGPALRDAVMLQGDRGEADEVASEILAAMEKLGGP